MSYNVRDQKARAGMFGGNVTLQVLAPSRARGLIELKPSVAERLGRLRGHRKPIPLVKFGQAVFRY